MAENRLEAVRHPLRASMLKILNDRAASPAELAKELDEPDVSKISYHARRLAELGCAELAYTRPGRRSSTEHVYRGIERHLLDLEDWKKVVESSTELADHLVVEYFQAMIDDMVAGCRASIGRDENFHITRTRILLDLDGLKEAVPMFERFRLEVAELEARVLERGGRTFPVSSSLAVFRTSDY